MLDLCPSPVKVTDALLAEIYDRTAGSPGATFADYGAQDQEAILRILRNVLTAPSDEIAAWILHTASWCEGDPEECRRLAAQIREEVQASDVRRLLRIAGTHACARSPVESVALLTALRVATLPPDLALCFLYRNHRDEVAPRRVQPRRVWFGSTPLHTEGWILSGFDLDKNADRDFALDRVLSWSEPPRKLTAGPTG